MARDHKKYCVEYRSGATGFGWSEEYDRLEEFEDFVNEERREYTAALRVYDYQLGEFIFWKDTLRWDPRIDMLHCMGRDMRTKTRKAICR